MTFYLKAKRFIFEQIFGVFMKNYVNTFVFLILSLIIISCESDSPPSNFGGKFVPVLNSQMTYRTTHLYEQYDDFGRINDTITYIDDEINVVEISSINDSVPGYQNLLRFDSGGGSTWYTNSDTALFAVAYNNPGSQWVFPKTSSKKYLTVNEAKKIISLINDDIMYSKSTHIDSIQYYEAPRVVVKYPLYVGQKWVELSLPSFLARERIVEDVSTVYAVGTNFSCYKNVAELSDYQIKIIDYFNLEVGIVKRVILSDSLAMTGPDNPDDIIGWGKFTTESVLIEKR
jgi:hypothetical protein